MEQEQQTTPEAATAKDDGSVGHEAQGVGYDSGARGHELQGRVLALDAERPLTGDRPSFVVVDDIIAAWPPADIAYLVIDVETSGLPIYTEEKDGKKVTVPADDPRQPWLAQACMIALNEGLVEVGRYAGYVKPEGWVMEEGATAANGLTTNFLREHGKPVGEVLDHYAGAIARGPVVIAHNAQFDCKLMRGALRRASRPDLFNETKNFCTMRMWAKRQGGKWPSFKQLCAHLDVEIKDAHTAIGDAEALVQCVRKMRAIGFAFEGEVHRSKLRDDGNG